MFARALGIGTRHRSELMVARIAAATVVTILIAALVFQALGAAPAAVFEAMLDGALGNPLGFKETILLTGILALAGLAVAIPARARLWNIGGEGQIFAGALASVTVALKLPGVDPILLTVLAVLAGVLAGALLGLVAGWLKAEFGAHEVLTTLMLNFIAILFADYAVGHFFPTEGAGNTTPPVPDGVALPELGASWLSVSALIALVAVLFAWLLISRTRLGLKIRALGSNRDAALQNGVKVERVSVAALAIGGAFAGLAGAIIVIGIDGSLARDFSPGYGYIGIAVAMMARSRALWVVPAAFLFAVLTVGGSYLEPTVGLSASTALVIEGLLILLLLAFWALPPERPPTRK